MINLILFVIPVYLIYQMLGAAMVTISNHNKAIRAQHQNTMVFETVPYKLDLLDLRLAYLENC